MNLLKIFMLWPNSLQEPQKFSKNHCRFSRHMLELSFRLQHIFSMKRGEIAKCPSTNRADLRRLGKICHFLSSSIPVFFWMGPLTCTRAFSGNLLSYINLYSVHPCKRCKKKKLFSWGDIMVSLRSWRLQIPKMPVINFQALVHPQTQKRYPCFDCQSPTPTSKNSHFLVNRSAD